MKKNFLKVFALLFCAALFMTGCATVSDVKIKPENYSKLIYSGGQVLVVENYLYFGNGYTDSSASDFNYDNAKKTGYLARLDLSKPLAFDDKVKDEEKSNSSPKNIEKVNGDKLFGYPCQDMYALGDYIYFTSANTHKTTELENDYTRVSLFRVKYNGDGFKELVKNSAFKQGEGSTITIRKADNNNYYYIIVEPSDNDTFTIKTLKIGNNLGKLTTIAKDVTSYAICDDDSVNKNIIFTVKSEQAQSTSAVKEVNIATGKVSDLDNGVTGSNVNLLGRVGDVVFYAYKNPQDKTEEVYYKNISNGESYFNPALSRRFYTATSISDIRKAGDGYAFKTSGGALMFKTLDTSTSLLMTNEDFTDILFVDKDYIYTSSTSSIKRISTIDKSIETILSLEDKEIVSGQCGYDGNYIYYYTKVDQPESEKDEEKEADENLYMFRTDKFGNTQLIGKKVSK